ncbi:AAA family ATPase [Burkholderia glumae]
MTQPQTAQKPISGGVAQIANLALCDIAITRAIQRGKNLPGLVVYYGPSGYGKSISANFVANQHRAYYVQAKSVWTKKHFLQAILFEMGIKPAGTIAQLADQVAEELASSGRPLIIDEFDHLVDRNAVEVVRDLYESTNRGFTVMSIEHTGGSAPTIQIQSCPACAAMIDRGEAVYYCIQGDGATQARKGQFKIDSVRVIWFERGH